jgi:hypothetical protein
LLASEKAAIYKNRVIHKICTIYSKDHAMGQGARTGTESAAETEVVQPTPPVGSNDTSPEVVGPS